MDASDFIVEFDVDVETYTFPSLGRVVSVVSSNRHDPIVLSTDTEVDR